MAYTTIDDPTIYFNTVLYTGNSSNGHAITGVGFQPDWLWIKNRTNAQEHWLADSVRGTGKFLESNSANAESSDGASGLASFDSDGFTVNSSARTNHSSQSMVAWNWKAGGTAPTQTYTVKVVSDSGNKYRFDDFGTSAVTLDLQEGGTYTFDQSDSSNSGHPLRFYTASDKSGGEYTTGVTTTGTAGSSGAKTVITVAASAPTLYYQCSNHAGMGGQVNTNSTFGSSNFSGSIQSTVSANTTAGFSIVSSTGNGSAGTTVGHGLGKKAQLIIAKNRVTTGGYNFNVYHHKNTSEPATEIIALNETGATSDSAIYWNDTDPTTSVFTLGSSGQSNTNGAAYIAYIFSEVKGYSRFGTYSGNNNADGTFVYTGFKPAWVMVKSTTSTDHWRMQDNKRGSPGTAPLYPHLSSAEPSANFTFDLLSNGFKWRNTDGDANASNTYIYMAFAESPFVNSNGVPTNAR